VEIPNDARGVDARALGLGEGAATSPARRCTEDHHAWRGQGRQGGRMMIPSIYPLESGRLYTLGELRAAEATLLAERQADQDLSSRLRVQDRNEIAWAKLRNEEWSPFMLLAGGLGLDDADAFRWTPAGAADFVATSKARTLSVQCTMAYDEPEEADYKRGHLHHLEMKHQEANGFYFGGGRISEPTGPRRRGAAHHVASRHRLGGRGQAGEDKLPGAATRPAGLRQTMLVRSDRLFPRGSRPAGAGRDRQEQVGPRLFQHLRRRQRGVRARRRKIDFIRVGAPDDSGTRATASTAESSASYRDRIESAEVAGRATRASLVRASRRAKRWPCSAASDPSLRPQSLGPTMESHTGSLSIEELDPFIFECCSDRS